MKYITPEISWHNRDPIYSIDIQPITGNIQRIASCGTDKNIRIWNVSQNEKGLPNVTYLSTLTRHSKTVNVVRFSPNGNTLASGGDDSFVILWQMNASAPVVPSFEDDEDIPSEIWTSIKILRTHLEDVCDLSWSSDGSLLLSGSMDNTSVLWDVKKGLKLHLFNAHKSYVQGVSLDPLNEFIITLSCDRSLRIFQMSDYKLLYDVKKMSLETYKEFRMFYDDSMKSFFRRMSFSPDGQFLIVPSGCIESSANLNENTTTTIVNTTYLFSRNDLSKPILILPIPSHCKATLAAKFCPIVFKLKISKKNNENEEKCESILNMSHRLVFAVASENSVILYDTQQPMPILFISNIHYDLISDLTWSSDGKLLVISSIDGYCTLVTFGDGELGEPIDSGPKNICSEVTREKVQDPQPDDDCDMAKKKSNESETLKQLSVPTVSNDDDASKIQVLPSSSLYVSSSTAPQSSSDVPSTSSALVPPSSDIPPLPSTCIPSTSHCPSSVSQDLPASITNLKVSKDAEVKKPRRVVVTTLVS